MTDELLTRIDGAAGVITLNRPKAIHALTLGMIEAMIPALQAWARDDAVKAVILEHAEGTRGFCAGGDVTILRRSALEDCGVSGRAFFYVEYQLNALLFDYAKPIVSFMDGVTMGGGVGIACPARYRVATENTKIAMPETGIGLFPDVGGGWHLSRLPGRLGQYLGLTGARMGAADCVWSGLATHYLKAETLAEAKSRIAGGEIVADVLGDLAADAPHAAIKGKASLIDRRFKSDCFEDILASLAGDEGEWAQETLATLRKQSPQACKVTLRELVEASRCATFAENIRMEYRVAARVLTLPDFTEGVRALLVDKTNDPTWQPPTPEGVSDADIAAIFAPLPANEEWQPLT